MKRYVLSTKTFGAKQWCANGDYLVSTPHEATKMSKAQAERIAAIPTCSPIIDWTIEEASEPPPFSVKLVGFLRKLWCLVAHSKHRTLRAEPVSDWPDWATCTKCGTWTTWFW